MRGSRTNVLRQPAKPETALPGIRLLGLTANDTPALVRLVRVGLPFSHWRRLEKTSGLSREKLARFTAISPRTLTRRQSTGRLQSAESDRVLRAARIFELAVALFDGNVAASREWLQTPQAGLGGEIPLEFAATEVGAREVENLIGRLEHGVFT